MSKYTSVLFYIVSMFAIKEYAKIEYNMCI